MHFLTLALLVTGISAECSNERSRDDHVAIAGAGHLEAPEEMLARRPEAARTEHSESNHPANGVQDNLHPDSHEHEEPSQEKSKTPKNVNAPPLFPASFLEGKPHRRADLEALNRANPPEIDGIAWINSNPLLIKDLKGKIIVLHFWATWCGPCLDAITKNNELSERYKDDMVLIGICHDRGVDNMDAIVKEKGIKYPVCRDENMKTIKSYIVDSYPDFYIIDKEGRLRIADCANTKVEDAIEQLLTED